LGPAQQVGSLVLASASPRRADLLRAAGFAFTTRPSAIEEWPYGGGDPARYAEELARAKAAGADGEVVVGADTIVVLDGEVLGKPRDHKEAASMLHRLSGRSHDVITAVAVKDARGLRSSHDRARVTFRPLPAGVIEAYAATDEPLDKAGSYALQGGAAGFVADLSGDPQTVIGLPISLLCQLLQFPAPCGKGQTGDGRQG
jgi:septum formation protein